MSGSGGSSPGKVAKQRQSKSCKRCLRRKQRCHGFPVCRGCAEAKVPCEQSAYALQLHSNDHSSYAAFQRIQMLETQLAGTLAELAILRQGQQQQPHQQEQQLLPCSGEDDFLLDNRPNHQDGRLQIPLFFGEAEDSSALLGGSGAGNAPPTVEQMVQSAVWSKGLYSVGNVVPPPSPLSPTSGRLSAPPPAPIGQLGSPLNNHASSSRAGTAQQQQPPDDAMGRRMLDAYFVKIHPRYPFLNRAWLFDLHARRQDPAPPTLAHRFNVFTLNMVYAIGGTLLKITDPLSEAQAETYLAVALSDVSVVQEASTLQTIEGLVLLVLYNLRAPTNSGIWYLTNLAMQTCIDLGLHLEASYHAETVTPEQSRKMRRLFWSAYVLDRFIALSFKRPFSIAEHDIETHLPPGEEAAAGGGDTTAAPSVMWRPFIEIKRLESRIQTEVYGLGEPLEQRRAKIDSLLASVDALVQSLALLPLSESEHVYLQLQWNGAVAQLLRPFLSTMRGDNPRVVRCLQASGNVCDVLKRMHQREAYGHSFVSAHLTFITGVTMCYCLFLAPHLFDPSVANNLRACSSTMFIIAERYHRLRKHRDILENIIGRVIDARMGSNAGIGSGSGSGSSGLNQSNANRFGNSQQEKQHQHFSQLDFVAVQSLLDLAAQQEPDTCTSPPAAPPQMTAMAIFPETSNQIIGSTSMLPLQSGPNGALDFNATESWDVDRYSLEMLGRMIGPE